MQKPADRAGKTFTKKDIFYLWATFDLLFFVFYIKNHLSFEKLLFGDFFAFVHSLPFLGDFLAATNSLNNYLGDSSMGSNSAIFFMLLAYASFLLYPLMLIGIILLYKQKTSAVVLAYVQAPLRLLSGTFSVFIIAYPATFINQILAKNAHYISAQSLATYTKSLLIATFVLAIFIEIFKLYTLTKATRNLQ